MKNTLRERIERSKGFKRQCERELAGITRELPLQEMRLASMRKRIVDLPEVIAKAERAIWAMEQDAGEREKRETLERQIAALQKKLASL